MSSLGEMNCVVQLSSAAHDFTQFAKCMLLAKGRPAEALDIAKARGASPRLQAILKSPITSGSVSGGTWGEQLAPFREAAAGFVASLAPFSAFDRLLADNAFTKMPLRTRIAIGSTAATASNVNELAPKPISQMSIGYQELPLWKAVGTLVVTDELVRSTSTSATDLFASELRKAVAVASDAKFLEIISEGTGVASSASTGLSAAQFLADLNTALQSVELGINSKPYLIVPASVAKTVALLTNDGALLFPQMGVAGGSIQGIRVVVSTAATDFAVLLDGTAVAADSDIANFEVAREATIQMDDDPTSGETSLVSLWQANLVALRAERYFGAAVLRSSGIAVITDFAVTS